MGRKSSGATTSSCNTTFYAFIFIIIIIYFSIFVCCVLHFQHRMTDKNARIFPLRFSQILDVHMNFIFFVFLGLFYRNRADGSGIKKPALDITRIFECCLGKIFLRAAMDIAVVTHFATATVLRAFLRTTKLTFIWVFVKSILASSPFGGRVSLKMFSSLKSIFVNCCQRCEVIKI